MNKAKLAFKAAILTYKAKKSLDKATSSVKGAAKSVSTGVAKTKKKASR